MTYLLVLALVAFGLPLGVGYGQRVRDEVRTQASAQARIVAIGAGSLIGAGDQDALASMVSASARDVRGRVLIVDADGVAIADSAGDAALGTSYADRPEIARALAGRSVQDERESRTLGQRLLVTAAPIDGGRAGAVRISQDTAAVDRAVRRNVLGLAVVSLAVLGFGLLAATFIARLLSGPVRRLEQAAVDVAEGDLSTRAVVEGAREQRALAESFNTMTERVARALRNQQDFVADASHQLRTPLAGMRLRLEAAQRYELPPDAARHLEAANGELDRLAQMVDELLLLSRTGERDAPGGEIDLRALVEDAYDRWAPALDERGQRLGRELAGAAPALVHAARVDVDRALDGLIENASRYSPPGTDVTLRLSGTEIQVLDEGPGLSEQDLEGVFERFSRGAVGMGAGPGTGLGLPIARELARRWGGDVKLENRGAGGAIATLTLPPLQTTTDVE